MERGIVNAIVVSYEGLCAHPSDVRVEHMPRDIQNEWPAGRHNLQSGTVRIYDLHSRLDIVNEGIKEDPYLKIDHQINLHVDIVAGDDSLPANGADLNFHIHNAERRSADVDVGKTRVDGLVEVSKVGDEPHRPYSTTVSVQRYVKEVGHIPSITPPLSRLSLDAHAPWRTHTCTSTTCNPQPRYTTAATAHLSPVTTTAAVYVLPPPPSTHRHRCTLCATGHCPLHAAAATVVYIPPLPHSRCPAYHPLPPRASHPCPRFSGPTTVYLCALPRPAPSPPTTHPILHGPICVTLPPTNASRGSYPCHTLDRDGT